MPLFKLFSALLCLALLTACGNKGPVRPLETRQPKSVQAPELRQQGDALLLGWQLPTSNQDGSPLKAQPVVDIYRSSYDPANECPECFDRSSLLVSINPELPTPAQRSDKRYLLHDRPLQAGSGYQYKLIARDSDGEQSRPIILRQTFVEPIPAPQQVVATAQDRSVLLQWQPAQLRDGEELIGYLLYRRLDDQQSLYPVSAQPLTEARFEDFSLENGRRYFYRVRLLVKRGKQQIEGRASEEVDATPQAGI
ncbi:hypothetical protein SAMN02745165_03066 [Malonomonas rubra DSM 5091]|uniref:Fibronectin type-III domain-containing protein n=1 Tax=Malonomonas rubra DSM 5091 TaxID=1122189 RepID=A0A1M6LSD9_MALRU|nr:fibronectin type III domain-containing protein [Malonomonas rubra]SHJ74022.1 hypothetical protein SAMN02745165_03066 [Malonomonas rubra DSM 5091]